MTNNDILRSIRYMLDLSEPKVVEVFKLADVDVEREDVKDFLRIEEDEQYLECDDNTMLSFLNGLVILKRGKNETAVAPDVTSVEKMSNNLVLKKLRVALLMWTTKYLSQSSAHFLERKAMTTTELAATKCLDIS